MRRTGYLLDRVYSFSEQKLQVMMRALLCLLALAASPVPAQQTSDTGAAVDLTTSLRPRARSSGAQGDAEPAAEAEDGLPAAEPEAIAAGEDALQEAVDGDPHRGG